MGKFKTARQAERAAESVMERVMDDISEHGVESITIVVTNDQGEEWLYRMDGKGGIYPVSAVRPESDSTH